RHTRSKRDWSSDVCFSDLLQGHIVEGGVRARSGVYPRIKHGPTIEKRAKRINQVDFVQPLELPPSCIHKGKRDSVVFGKFARNLDGRGQRVSVFEIRSDCKNRRSCRRRRGSQWLRERRSARLSWGERRVKRAPGAVVGKGVEPEIRWWSVIEHAPRRAHYGFAAHSPGQA